MGERCANYVCTRTACTLAHTLSSVDTLRLALKPEGSRYLNP